MAENTVNQSGFIPDSEFVSDQDKYGGSLEQMGKAGLEGVAEGVAGPLGPLAETKLLGIDPKDIQGRAEANPIIHGAGQVAGLALPGGQGSLLGEVGAAAGELGGASKAIQGALNIGTQAALFQTGSELSKEVLGNPDSIQTAAINVGLSGLLGAGLGGGLGKVSDLWSSKLGPKAQEFTEGLQSALQEKEPLGSFDPFRKQAYEGQGFDPSLDFLNKKVEQAVSNSSEAGAKTADLIHKKALEMAKEAASAGLGAAVGRMTGIPGMGKFGALFGQRALRPLMDTILPPILKPLLEKAPSAEGLKAAIDGLLSVEKGDRMATEAAKAIFLGATKAVPSALLPSDKHLDSLDKKTQEMANNMDSLLDMGGAIGHYLPDHSTALAKTAVNALQYVNSQRPLPTPGGPLDKPIEPLNAQKEAFKRTLTLADQPLSIMNHIQAGTLTPKDLQDLQAMYPALYPKLMNKITDAMISHKASGGEVPYRTKMGLSLFMGQPMDLSLVPSSIMSAQASHHRQDQPQALQPQRGRPPSASSLKGISQSASAYRTPLQAADTRRATLK